MMRSLVFVLVVQSVLSFASNSMAAQTLCESGEKTYLSCKISSKEKILSVCGSKKGEDDKRGPVIYKFGGTNGSIEFSYPQVAIKGGAFRFSRYTRPQVTYLTLSFQNVGYTYEIFSEANMESGKEESSRGVRVSKSGEKTIEMRCQNQAIDSMMELEYVIEPSEKP